MDSSALLCVVSLSDRFEEATGYLDLGMCEDAWNVTEDLPPIDRVEPLVLELRLRILTAMEKWELGEGIANVLLSSAVEPQKCRKTVARFHHACARASWQSGDYDSARDQFRLAVDAWRDVRREFSDEDLNALCEE